MISYDTCKGMWFEIFIDIDIDKLPPTASISEYLFCIFANLNFKGVLVCMSLITSKVEHLFIPP